MKSEHPPPMADLIFQLEKARKSIFKSPVAEELIPEEISKKTESVMSEISENQSASISVVSKLTIPKVPIVECDPFPFLSVATGKKIEVNPHLNQQLRYDGKKAKFEATLNNEIFVAPRVYRKWMRQKYQDTFTKLDDGSKDALNDLQFFTPECNMDIVVFGILKPFYATIVSIDRNEACV